MYNLLLKAQHSGQISGLPRLSKTVKPTNAISTLLNNACRDLGGVDSPIGPGYTGPPSG